MKKLGNTETELKKKAFLISDGCRSHPSDLSYLVLNKRSKNKNTEYNSVFESFKSQASSKQGNPIFLLFELRSLVYLLVWVNSKFFFDNSNLTTFVDVQSLHENGKWIIFFTKEDYTLRRKTFLLFHSALSKCFIHSLGTTIPVVSTKN